MMFQLQWLGHGTWLIELGTHRVLLDPFLNDNPAATSKAADFESIDQVLVSHGHQDHVADVVEIAERCNAKVIAMVEVANWFASQGVKDTVGMNLGGTFTLPWGTVKMVPALHSSSMPDGTYGGVAAGFIISADGRSVYFACDTDLFGDMSLIGRSGLDLAVLPIGDHFTMGPQDSLDAIHMLKPKKVVPAHYNTWPVIAQDAEQWAQQVKEKTDAEPAVLAVGEILEV